jgi:hypothetical protein
MDIEFHYYMTYLIAARAGFPTGQALTIAHAAQSVDDNHIRYVISGSPGETYNNYISQTLNILKPSSQLLRIYPIFHFIPGDPNAVTALRADGRTDPWVTTPGSAVAGSMIGNALTSRNLYRIGVSAHGYADTWAHQNFLGRRDTFNDIPSSPWVTSLLNVGHGSAGHQPDHPALVWRDPRLATPDVDNRERFLDAAEALFRRFVLHVDPARNAAVLTADAAFLRRDLSDDIGPDDAENNEALGAARLARYQTRALTAPYGGVALPAYVQYLWFNAAVSEEGAWLRQKLDDALNVVDDYLDQTTAIPCSWRNPDTFRQTDWYQFAEAVKDHQNACWDILLAESLPGLDAPNM